MIPDHDAVAWSVAYLPATPAEMYALLDDYLEAYIRAALYRATHAHYVRAANVLF